MVLISKNRKYATVFKIEKGRAYKVNFCRITRKSSVVASNSLVIADRKVKHKKQKNERKIAKIALFNDKCGIYSI